MGFVSDYTYYTQDMADARVKDWLFMSGPSAPALIITIYAFIIFVVGPRFMKNRKPFNLTNVIRIYNVFQIITCIVITYGVITNGWTTKYSVFRCTGVDYSDDPMAVRLLTWTWLLMNLKIVDLIETVFFILRKKSNQISGLHIYHHISTVIIMWLGTKYWGGGSATFSALLNNSVHIIMYTYYLLSTLGPEWQKSLAKWKPKLTMIQMIQFCILLAYGIRAFGKDCDMSEKAMYIFLPNLVVNFYLFYDFYKKSYNKPSQKSTAQKIK